MERPKIKQDSVFGALDLEFKRRAQCWWLTHIILATWGRLRLEGSQFKASMDKQFERPYLQNNQSGLEA
jgi:hypothetical protein